MSTYFWHLLECEANKRTTVSLHTRTPFYIQYSIMLPPELCNAMVLKKVLKDEAGEGQ